ncbi:Holliday junction branch migration protein RuvA [Pinisolibacter aquiterrae]|jgi:Holliday junction DNA helicase RuvA|uniref:Holliday junction branch migration protein RuvA n=1 Tax=Pinisolibacter aquiterrae TaxID=2815579 RepID=UPI001C3E2026|nr:Holliday junction branch migration protein RuvA [Pinisolibacter aquiterrae]MBV5263541.1 Holliday junction branch migration protein RuvA [Pinisolibacter aquiterrae]MCC8237405.1 Holliday junction branch migration protein RuvA [Pinisolibacter aquiterrae]
MIGKLRGLVDEYGDDWVILDVGGVGYVCYCSSRTLQHLPAPGEAAVLSIETIVREDMIRLYGFADAEERDWFRLLTTVQGVGTKVALALLSALRPNEIASAIALKDVTALSRANGVGKRLAERIAQELKDKAPAFASVDPALVALSGGIAEKTAPKPLADAVSALVNLGYPQIQASAAVAAASREAGEDATTEKLIRLGLKELAK